MSSDLVNTILRRVRNRVFYTKGIKVTNRDVQRGLCVSDLIVSSIYAAYATLVQNVFKKIASVNYSVCKEFNKVSFSVLLANYVGRDFTRNLFSSFKILSFTAYLREENVACDSSKQGGVGL